MSKTIRDGIVLATEKEVKSVLLIDAQSVTSEKEKFLEANLLGYYICINTWLLLIKQYTAFTYLNVKDRIFRYGLLQTIGYFSDAAQKLVHDGTLSDDAKTYALPESILREVTVYCGKLPIFNDDGRRVNVDPVATALQLFRYAKRFSPMYTDKLAKASITDFISEQNRLKLLQRREHNSLLVSQVKEEVYSLLPWDVITEEIRSIRLCDIELTHGAGLDANSSIGSKLRALSRTVPDYFLPWEREPYLASLYCDVNEGWYGEQASYPIHVAEVRAVPKNYKTARIIAMEQTYRQALAKRVFTIVSRHLPASLDIHNQVRNQDLARNASISGDLATIDLSHASDDIQCNTVWEVFPSELISYLELVRPTHFKVDGKIRLLHSYMTMGNAMTFVLETILFAAITRAAVRSVCPDRVDQVSVYGDDIICPTDAVETVMEYLEHFGFQVNRDKSFYFGSYRESCGEEFMNGECLSTYYFPRFAVQGTLGQTCKLADAVQRDSYTEELSDTSTRLIALQHRLIRVCPSAARLVEEVIRENNPKMTMSLVGEDSQDLWGFDVSTYSRKLPYYTLERKTKEVVITFESSRRTLGRDLPPMKMTVDEGLVWKRVDEVHTVEEHLKPRAVFECRGKVSDEDRRLYDQYRHNQFLLHGPQYEDPFMELLKVSSKDLSIEQVFGFPKMTWR